MSTVPSKLREGSAPLDPGLASAEETDPVFLSNLGRRVREAREQRGMARKALSREADVSERYLAQLEAGPQGFTDYSGARPGNG